MEFSPESNIVAIDGPSGTGKSTTAKLLAKKLRMKYLDTGAMYRALTWKALNTGVQPEEESKLAELVNRTQIEFDYQNRIYVDGHLREDEIRHPRVTDKVSLYCQSPSVRQNLTEKQREIGSQGSWVLDGRDIGTVVFPNARFKFFLVADYSVRAHRRLKELLSKGIQISLEEVEQNLRERDRLDAGREIAPLRKSDDSVEINTTHMTIDEQVDAIAHQVVSTGNINW